MLTVSEVENLMLNVSEVENLTVIVAFRDFCVCIAESAVSEFWNFRIWSQRKRKQLTCTWIRRKRKRWLFLESVQSRLFHLLSDYVQSQRSSRSYSSLQYLDPKYLQLCPKNETKRLCFQQVLSDRVQNNYIYWSAKNCILTSERRPTRAHTASWILNDRFGDQQNDTLRG